MIDKNSKEKIKELYATGNYYQKDLAKMFNLKLHQIEYIIRQSYMDDYYRKNKEKILEERKNYRVLHKEEIKTKKKEYRETHKEEIKIKKKQYRETHKEQRNEYERERKENDINYRILTNLRNRIGLAIHSQKARKFDRTINLLGCDYEQLKQHLENQFRDGMNWENYGKVWQVDHIIPCAAFDLTKEEQQKECFNYKNLQPLLVEENQIKNDFLPNGERGRNVRRICR